MLTVAQLADALVPIRQKIPNAPVMIVVDKFDTELVEVEIGDFDSGNDEPDPPCCWLITESAHPSLMIEQKSPFCPERNPV